MTLKRLAKLIMHRLGYDLTIKRTSQVIPKDLDADTIKVIDRVWSLDEKDRLTMTSPERLNAFCNAVQYIERSNIPGAIVECGVWKGGSMMAAALTLNRLKVSSRELYLFDTFEGMTEPTALDIDRRGAAATDRLAKENKDTSWVWAQAGIDEVKRNLKSTNYNFENIYFIKGPVEETVPKSAPNEIAILRLDTDWYESTRHELEHLYPRLVRGGVLIIDDYGDWEGAKRAVDEFIETCDHDILLNRIDSTGRIAVKPLA